MPARRDGGADGGVDGLAGDLESAHGFQVLGFLLKVLCDGLEESADCG